MTPETTLPQGQEQIDEAAIEQYARDDGALSFKLEIFEGPLELLLSLITKNKAQSIIIAAVTPAPTAVPTNMGLKYRLLCSFFLRFDI